MHRTSHDGELQTIGPVHDPAPLHTTLHLLPLHVIRCVHAPAPTQLSLHALAPLQSIVPVHEPAPVQVRLQGMPAGHTTGSVHVPAATHAMRQVPSLSHVPTPASAQSEGQARMGLITGASGTSASALASPPPPPPSPSLAAPSAFVVASVVDASSEPNVTSGKPHATARTPQAARTDDATRTTRGRARWSKTATPRKNWPRVSAYFRRSLWRALR